MQVNNNCWATTILGRVCRAFFSVGKAKAGHANDGNDESSKHIHDELKLCLETFSELLSAASLDWKNVLVSCT
jgi:enamine deaminase RidA (YjgF/YER057c/UK114 family)